MKLGRVTGIALIVVVGLLAFGAYAFAQSSGDPGPAWARARGWHGGEHGPGWWHDGDRGPDAEQVRQFRADLAADLAGQLDTSANDVEAAFRAVVAQRLQEAVEAGEIEQEQADDALAAYEEGDLRGLLRLLKPLRGDN